MMVKSLAMAAALAAVSLPLVAPMAQQADYPACPINHKPRFFCVDFGGDEKVLYTLYNRPKGGAYEKYYEDGWKMSRRINWVGEGELSKYKPDAPEYEYGNPDKTCRLTNTLVKGQLTHKMECTFAPKDGDKRFTQNTSLALEADGSLFLHAKPNPRNNNASFPTGALSVKEIFTQKEKDDCHGGFGSSSFYFTSFVEWELSLVYALYAANFVFLAIWTVARIVLATRTPKPASADFKSLEEGSKKLLDNRGGPQTPGLINAKSSAMRSTEARLRNSVEDIVQTGYTDSIFGKSVFGYFTIMTVLLNAIIIVFILDNTGHFSKKENCGAKGQPKCYDALFNPMEILIKYFISMWVITSVLVRHCRRSRAEAQELFPRSFGSRHVHACAYVQAREDGAHACGSHGCVSVCCSRRERAVPQCTAGCRADGQGPQHG
ncbi:hypothetical protein PINS_up020171 [Pythium insidiosum]|nr:hypothetical protein PINS_up020171 [Pythium insidiosum]